MIQSTIFQVISATNIENLLVSLIGALVGAGAALTVFFLNVKNEKAKELQRRKRHLRNKIKYFSSLVDTINESLKKQVEHYDDYAKKVTDYPYEAFPIKIVINNNFIRITEKMDQEDIFYAYIELLNKEEQEILKTLNSIDFIHTTMQALRDFLFNNLQYLQEIKTNYEKISEEILDGVSFKLRELKDKNAQDFETLPLYSFLNSTIDNYYSSIKDEQTIPEREKHFIQPLKEGLLTNKFEEIIEKKWLLQCKECTHIYSEIDLRTKDLAKEIKNVASRIKEKIPELEKTNQIIQAAF